MHIIDLLRARLVLLHFFVDSDGWRIMYLSLLKGAVTPDWSELNGWTVTVATTACPAGIHYELAERRVVKGHLAVHMRLVPPAGNPFNARADTRYLVNDRDPRSFRFQSAAGEEVILDQEPQGFYRTRATQG